MEDSILLFGCRSSKMWRVDELRLSVHMAKELFLLLGLLSFILLFVEAVDHVFIDCHGQAENALQEINEPAPRFWIANDTFWKDGEQFKIIGGDIHYFRVHPSYWEDRLLRTKALGLNTIQSYVAWNIHEPTQGKFNFDGFGDLVSFLKLAQKLELLVMLRIGPYICGEWDFGGFPAWLLAQPRLQLRSSDPSFLSLVKSWWDVLLPKLVPLLYCNEEENGPIIMVQIENEFGSYGNDKKYIQYLVSLARAHLGENVILYTTDGGTKENLERGTLLGADVYSAVDFPINEDPAPIFQLQKQFNAPGKSPPLTAEFYTGWLTHWGESFARTNVSETAEALEKILSLNGSIVLYMAHGGTNFGFSSGANTASNSTDYQPDITSYDYDAPIGEAGDVENNKFIALRKVLANYQNKVLPDPPELPKRRSFGKVTLRKLASLSEILSQIMQIGCSQMIIEPPTMESVNQFSGFLLYQTTIPDHLGLGSKLYIPEVHDRAQIFIWTDQQIRKPNCQYIGAIERWKNRHVTLLDSAYKSGSKLLILVENMGRVNYGRFLYDPKGILSSVLLDDNPIFGWSVYPISLDDVSTFMEDVKERSQKISNKQSIWSRKIGLTNNNVTTKLSAESCELGGFYQGWLQIKDSADAFLSLKGWTKGLAFINGFNLGRFWPSVGPQCTLYIPAPLLQLGQNELVIFELEKPQTNLEVQFVDKADFSCSQREDVI